MTKMKLSKILFPPDALVFYNSPMDDTELFTQCRFTYVVQDDMERHGRHGPAPKMQRPFPFLSILLFKTDGVYKLADGTHSFKRPKYWCMNIEHICYQHFIDAFVG